MSTQKSPPNKPPSFGSTLNEAQSIIDAAEKRAAEILSSAEKAYEDSRNSGYQTGYAEGVKEATETAIRLIEEGAIISARLADEAARLALAISATVIGEHIKVAPEVVKKIAERALQQSIVGGVITIFANPEDKLSLEEALGSFRRIASGANITIETDPSIMRGGCIVRTEFGEVDASLPVLLESVAGHLGISERAKES